MPNGLGGHTTSEMGGYTWPLPKTFLFLLCEVATSFETQTYLLGYIPDPLEFS
jgi:hypothetical protein